MRRETRTLDVGHREVNLMNVTNKIISSKDIYNNNNNILY